MEDLTEWEVACIISEKCAKGALLDRLPASRIKTGKATVFPGGGAYT